VNLCDATKQAAVRVSELCPGLCAQILPVLRHAAYMYTKGSLDSNQKTKLGAINN